MNTVHVLYYCGCWRRVRVDQARTSVCETHGIDAQKVNTHEWRVRCPDCRYGRWCGQDRASARRKQRDHMTQHPTHAPSVAYDRVTYDGHGTILRQFHEPRNRDPRRDTLPACRSDGPPPF